MPRLPLTFACGDYDRTRALEEGTVRPDGIELTYLRLPVEETFFRMMRHQEFEVAEMSLSSYVVSLRADPPPFVALPVFTSRMFRHGALYCHADSGIATPEDLRGKRIGTPEYQLTACVWMRGILGDRHDVPFDSVSYLTGGQETPGRIEKAGVDLPDSLRISRIPEDRTLGTCSRRARSTRCARPACRARSSPGTRAYAGCSRTSSPPRRSTTRRPASSRSCTSS
ncbi:hypothetical protein [Streptomyces sp. NPDC050534]|uniref:hypothetical protein n=1 Tax=Streptomyces sp. NPDC050534 TaxID=3365625 RepID=UPI0037B8B8E9